MGARAGGAVTIVGGGLLVGSTWLTFVTLEFMGLAQSDRGLDTRDGGIWVWMGLGLVGAGVLEILLRQTSLRRAVAVAGLLVAGLVVWGAVENIRLTRSDALANIAASDRPSVHVTVGVGQLAALAGAALALVGGGIALLAHGNPVSDQADGEAWSSGAPSGSADGPTRG